ncbi:HemK2/MTQ2 family protein methyltransferase [Thermoplasma sp.]|uniref:HemK2/MTQ2 family protein methyltransferase n=1 Tax=Thermoplasma sp. TaxID=1973142 RepID=UPI0012819F89|nr:HemK2/MTQ2 family protein methyltransferase [Thermoplasma sp.]KAA8922311.1 MAG: methyltransferase [Thermoplasma sp.]
MEYCGLHIEECDGVYPPSDDSFLLAENATCSGRSIEIGCGTGIVSICLLKRGCEIEAVDISDLAVECARANALRNGLHLNVHHSDLFSDVHGKFDTILFNAPYLPVSGEDISWSGGEKLEVVSRFLHQAKLHLNPSGCVYLVLTDLTDNEAMFMDNGYEYTVVKKIVFDFEAIILYRLTLSNAGSPPHHQS